MSRIPFLDLAGAEIGGYKFVSKLGGGGSATVYLAKEVTDQHSELRTVAIKVFLADANHRDQLQAAHQSFNSDLACLARLHSDAPIMQYFTAPIYELVKNRQGEVVTFSRLQEETNQVSMSVYTAFMIVMEYADGGSLDGNYRDIVIASGDGQYISDLIDVCMGLQAAHENDIVHRDIKPANLFWFRRVCKVKLGDFGVAMYGGDHLLCPQFAIVGTLPYIAPEVFDGQKYSDKTDVYALGCTFYELLTGDRAFAPTSDEIAEFGNRTVALYQEIHRQRPRPDAIANTTIPSVPLSGMIKQMMSVNPKQRPSLERVIETLELEKSARTANLPLIGNLDESTASRRPPADAFSNLINPKFRHEILGETCYFIFVDLQSRKEGKVSILEKLLQHFFSNTPSIWEVFGEHTFLIQTWSSSIRRVCEFLDAVRSKLLYSTKHDRLKIMACEHADYIGVRWKVGNVAPGKVDAMIKLYEAQTFKCDEAKNWLVKNGIYAGSKGKSPGKTSFRCFCFARSTQSHEDEHSRKIQNTILRDAIQSADLPKSLSNMALFRKAYSPVSGVPNAASDHVITYRVRSVEDAAAVPEIIMNGVETHDFHTKTIVATKRKSIECDSVFL